MHSATIRVEHLDKTYVVGTTDLAVLKDLSCSFRQGASYALIGASGSGKSTFLASVGGLDKPTGGRVMYEQMDIYKLKQHAREALLNKTFGFVFQFHYLIKELTVVENIIMPGLIHGANRLSCTKHALELLDRVGLADKAASFPGHLSGGEQQRVAAVRALFNKPQFLFADEPTGNLDANSAAQIITLFKSFVQEYRMGLILCSHDPAVYGQMHNVLELHNGRLRPSSSKESCA